MTERRCCVLMTVAGKGFLTPYGMRSSRLAYGQPVMSGAHWKADYEPIWPGVPALGYGFNAVARPKNSTVYVVAECIVPAGTYVAGRPWLMYAEELIIRRLRLPPPEEVHYQDERDDVEAVLAHWSDLVEVQVGHPESQPIKEMLFVDDRGIACQYKRGWEVYGWQSAGYLTLDVRAGLTWSLYFEADVVREGCIWRASLLLRNDEWKRKGYECSVSRLDCEGRRQCRLWLNRLDWLPTGDMHSQIQEILSCWREYLAGIEVPPAR